MKQATIEIRTKEVVPFSGIIGGYHSYIILTLANDEQYILRAGPAEQNALTGDVHVVGADKMVPYTKENEKIHLDWDEKQSHLHQQVASGTDTEMLGLFAKMQEEGKRINEVGYDYETLQQNCNTSMFEMLRAAGIEPIMPTMDGEPISLLGMESGFEHGVMDKTVDYVQEKYEEAVVFTKETVEKVENTVSTLQEKFESFQLSDIFFSTTTTTTTTTTPPPIPPRDDRDYTTLFSHYPDLTTQNRNNLIEDIKDYERETGTRLTQEQLETIAANGAREAKEHRDALWEKIDHLSHLDDAGKEVLYDQCLEFEDKHPDKEVTPEVIDHFALDVVLPTAIREDKDLDDEQKQALLNEIEKHKDDDDLAEALHYIDETLEQQAEEAHEMHFQEAMEAWLASQEHDRQLMEDYQEQCRQIDEENEKDEKEYQQQIEEYQEKIEAEKEVHEEKEKQENEAREQEWRETCEEKIEEYNRAAEEWNAKLEREEERRAWERETRTYSSSSSD